MPLDQLPAVSFLKAWKCPTLYNPMNISFSVHGVLQAIILEWVAISSSRGSSQPGDLNPGLLHCRQTLYSLSCREAPLGLYWTRRQRNPFLHFKAPSPPQWVPGGFCEVWLPLCQPSCFMSLLILGILRKTVPSGLLGFPCVRRSRSEFLEVLEIWG